MAITLLIHSIDNGFCRINYKTKNDYNQTVVYCIQDEGETWGCRVYRSTPELEPDYQVKPKTYNIFEIPTGDSTIEIEVRKFLEEKICQK